MDSLAKAFEEEWARHPFPASFKPIARCFFFAGARFGMATAQQALAESFEEVGKELATLATPG